MKFAKFLFIIFLLPHVSIFAEPWGKDADLATKKGCSKIQECQQNGIGIKISEVLIDFHQNVISPADGPRSHFKPSSSQYALDAIRKYGFFHGYIMGCDRLMRENNETWIYPVIRGDYNLITKYDPVR